jgi:biotin transport system substrate-specific component
MRRKILVSVTLVALFAALIAAGTFITIPMGPVPFVLQNMFALLAGLILGPLLGGAAAALYLLAGAIGAPVFAGASGGFVQFLSPSGGYLYGYALSALVAGILMGSAVSGQKKPLWLLIVATLTGLLIVYVPGLLWLKAKLALPWPGTFAIGFLPFVIGDAIKGVIAVIITPRLRRTVTDLFIGS